MIFPSSPSHPTHFTEEKRAIRCSFLLFVTKSAQIRLQFTLQVYNNNKICSDMRYSTNNPWWTHRVDGEQCRSSNKETRQSSLTGVGPSAGCDLGPLEHPLCWVVLMEFRTSPDCGLRGLKAGTVLPSRSPSVCTASAL